MNENDDLIRILNHIQVVSDRLQTLYKPELISEANSSGKSPTVSVPSDGTTTRSKDYDRLMKQQRQLVYKRDNTAQEKAEIAMNQHNDQKKDDDLKQKMSARINFRSAKEEMADHTTDLQKPWNKLSNNLRIQAALKFIEVITPFISEKQTNQLRYLLISSISQRNLNKISDLDYDSEIGQINKIHRLVFDKTESDTNTNEGTFRLSDINEGEKAIGLSTYIIPTPPKEIKKLKLTLKKI